MPMKSDNVEAAKIIAAALDRLTAAVNAHNTRMGVGGGVQWPGHPGAASGRVKAEGVGGGPATDVVQLMQGASG